MSGARLRTLSAAPWLLAVAALSTGAAVGGPSFVDATAGSGIEMRNLCGAEPGEKGWLSEAMGAGAAWLDYDGDGNLDLFVVNGGAYERERGQGEPNRLFRGDGKGKFTDVTARSGLGDKKWGYGVAVGDIDNDGDPDLFVSNRWDNALYRNNGDGTFANITKTSGIRGEVWSSSSAFFDIDGDGDLDLYVGNYMLDGPGKVPRRGSPEALRLSVCTYMGVPVLCGPNGQVPVQDSLYRNDGDGKFTEITHEAGMWLEKPRFALGVVTGDYDNDGLTDLYVANDSMVNSLWKNNGDGTFSDVGLQKLAALNSDGRPQAGMGTDFGDYDGDGWLDIVVTNFSHDLNTLYRNLGGKFFVDESTRAGLGVTQLALSWGTGFHDLENDGDQDLLIANGHLYIQVNSHDIGTRFKQQNHLFVNDGGKYRLATNQSGPGLALRRSFRSAVFGDYDNDGDVDVFLTTLNDAPVLLRNESPDPGHWLGLKLIGNPSNRDAIGARVRVVTGEVARIRERKSGGSYLASGDPRLHFGLGSATRADRVEIRWPDGKTQLLENVKADQILTVKQGAK